MAIILHYFEPSPGAKGEPKSFDTALRNLPRFKPAVEYPAMRHEFGTYQEVRIGIPQPLDKVAKR